MREKKKMYRKEEKEKGERTYMQVDGERRENTGARGENEKNCKRGDFKPTPHLQMFGSHSLTKGVGKTREAGGIKLLPQIFMPFD